jgi:hypothetical protein
MTLSKMCRPPGEWRYMHMESLFSPQAEWDLIETMLPESLQHFIAA